MSALTLFGLDDTNSGGSSAQLAAKGLLSSFLNAAPTLQWWQYQIKQYSDFAIQWYLQSLDNNAQAGSTSPTKIQKVGDNLYIVMGVTSIPGIRPCPPSASCGGVSRFPYAIDPSNACAETDAAYFSSVNGGRDAWLSSTYGCCGTYDASCGVSGCVTSTVCDTTPFCYYTNAVGVAAFKSVKFMVGITTISEVTRESIYMLEELQGKPGRRFGENVGKRSTIDELIADSQCARELYCPFPFYFCQAPGLVFPMSALLTSWPTLNIHLAPLNELIIVSGPDVQVTSCSTGAPIRSDDIKYALLTMQIFVDLAEREMYGQQVFKQIITTSVTNFYDLDKVSTNYVDLPYQLTVKQFSWALRRKCQSQANQWFNFSGLAGRDPMVSAAVKFSNMTKQEMSSAMFYRYAVPYCTDQNVPSSFVYTYSFALFPKDWEQPSGGCNFTRVIDPQLQLVLQPGVMSGDGVEIILTALQYNVLTVNGKAGNVQLLFAAS